MIEIEIEIEIETEIEILIIPVIQDLLTLLQGGRGMTPRE